MQERIIFRSPTQAKITCCLQDELQKQDTKQEKIQRRKEKAAVMARLKEVMAEYHRNRLDF